MNVEAPMRGLVGFLKSLNCDRAYGWALLAACAFLALLELGGDPLRNALSYDRAALAQGEWWRLVSAHFVTSTRSTRCSIPSGGAHVGACSRATIHAAALAGYLSGSSLTISAGLWMLNPECRGMSGRRVRCMA
jgi:hypothetical protein